MSEIVGRDWFATFVPAKNQGHDRGQFLSVLTTQSDDVRGLETTVARRDGTSRVVSWRIAPFVETDGTVSGLLCAGEDITEKRDYESRLLALSRRNETILNAAGDGIYGLDRNGLATFINPAAASMLGFQAGDLIGQPLHDIIHHTRPDGRPHDWADCPIHRAARDGVVQVITDDVFWRREGTSFPVEYTATPVVDGDSVNGAVVVFRDVTEQRTLQAQLIQSSKMATLGEMATGVAHELNQPLNVIRMASENIMRKLGKGAIGAEYLQDKVRRITTQTVRAAAIIDHMRIFGRPASHHPERLYLDDVVNSTLDLVGEQLRLANIDVQVDMAPDCPAFLGHAVQVEQVLLNLLTNARDALRDKPGAGARIIKLTGSHLASEGKVRLSIADSAGGIDPAILERIFEPFYTTKDVGQGTGLGLSISYGIVVDMGGTIMAENRDGGAAFTIEWPTANEQEEPQP